MSRAAELREKSRAYLEQSEKETDPNIKRSMASHAFFLAQLAEKIERNEGGKR